MPAAEYEMAALPSKKMVQIGTQRKTPDKVKQIYTTNDPFRDLKVEIVVDCSIYLFWLATYCITVPAREGIFLCLVTCGLIQVEMFQVIIYHCSCLRVCGRI